VQSRGYIRIWIIAVGLPVAHGANNLIRRRYSDIGGDERFFKRVDRVDVHGPRSARRFFRAADDVVEPFDELLLGTSERGFDFVEETHGQSESRSDRWGRSIRRSTASRAVARPSSTAAIWAASGSSTPWGWGRTRAPR